MSKYLLKDIYFDRAKELIAKLESASLVTHSTTTGTLKELAIINSITNIIPHDYDINNGFVTGVNKTLPFNPRRGPFFDY